MLSKITGKKYSLLVLFAALLVYGGSYTVQTNQAKAFKKDVSATASNHLNTVKQRGYLICGISGEIPGFSFINAEDKYVGLDVDICRAIAAAIFDDPTKVKFRNLNAEERFDVLKSGEIDLLSRNTTLTLSRDTNKNLEFTPTTFYDAQGIMVSQASKIKSLGDLEGKSICVSENTTSYDNLRDYMSREGISYQPVTDSDGKSLFNAYEYNYCQGITGDISSLVARKLLLANPREHQILSQTIAQEPLAPVILYRDSRWFDVVKWVTFALIQAEELGINSTNISSLKNSSDAEIRRFLGKNSSLGSEMGLSDDFTLRIIKHVGNYQEIYDRNIAIPFGLERGQNALWKDGGLMYSPPFN